MATFIFKLMIKKKKKIILIYLVAILASIPTGKHHTKYFDIHEAKLKQNKKTQLKILFFHISNQK